MAGMENMSGEFQSPGGFVFGVQGWNWGEARPKTITFFLDGTAKVCDQHGRPIRGTVLDGKEVKFAIESPTPDGSGNYEARPQYASHAQTIAALDAERIDWRKLACAGWPQLPYAELVKIKPLPPTPLAELRKIVDPVMRKDAMKARREADDLRAKELQTAEVE